MIDTLLIPAQTEMVRSLDSALTALQQGNGHGRPARTPDQQAHFLELITQVALRHSETTRFIWTSTRALIADEWLEISESERLGRLLLQMLDASIGFLDHLHGVCTSPAGRNLPAADIAALEKAAAETRELRERIFTRWPWADLPDAGLDREMIAASREAIKRGEYQEVGELIRELQGDRDQAG